MQILKILQDYISAKDTDYAIMIGGEWGAGKSWFWNNALTPELEAIELPDQQGKEKKKTFKVATISLFGISSPEELRLRIFEETAPLLTNKYVKTGFKLAFNKIARDFNVDKTLKSDVLNLTSELAINLDNHILCFDDLERIKPNLLIELLGYINTFIEHEHVKVVFICNESELKDEEYHKYKEKIIRFTHLLKVDIKTMVDTFANTRFATYRDYIKQESSFIASVYAKGNCNNLRTLKFNLDIFEHIFDLVCETFDSNKNHTYEITNYMLLLSMIYSIEYRRDNDDKKLLSLQNITRRWNYQMDTLTGLERMPQERTEKPVEQSPEEILRQYIKEVREKYFRNTYIYGSSPALINYLLTGYCDDDAMRRDILAIEKESQRYGIDEAKELYQNLMQLWDTDDDVMKQSVQRTLERVAKSDFYFSDYPVFFLLLQRLQKLEIINLGLTTDELKERFETAIHNHKLTAHIDDTTSYYYSYTEISTPEFEALVQMVKDKNNALYDDERIAAFERIARDKNSCETIDSYTGCPNLFRHITAEEFFNLFLSYKNCRKKDYLNFIDERYRIKKYYNEEQIFIKELMTNLKAYLDNPNTPYSGTRFYCRKLWDVLNK